MYIIPNVSSNVQGNGKFHVVACHYFLDGIVGEHDYILVE